MCSRDDALVATVILHPVTQLSENIDWHRFLGRPPLESRSHQSTTSLRRHPVLITGAGGSIGSALALRLVAFGCETILLESAESNLYELQNELSGESYGRKASLYLGDAGDAGLLGEIFAAHRPRLVFHTAAFKHVGLLEEQPFAAIANNVFATQAVVAAAYSNDARVVLLSTDKAVAPWSVMGATKCIAEQIVYASGGTVVRLVNVLASRGSVCEVFATQIGAGGPLTVTDPGSERYFVTISEAVELLLAAPARSDGAALFVPQLRKAHLISELARFMEASLRDGGELPIEFTGLRAGEKMVEQLWSAGEMPEEGASEGLLRVEPRLLSRSLLADLLDRLREKVATRDPAGVIDCLRALVPDYQPSTTVLGLGFAQSRAVDHE
jgi:FlaA1/EpsC-like NDP-sugar epimerase